MKSAVTESNFKGMSDDQFTREFGKPSIRIGSITLIIGFVLAFVPAFTLWLVYGVVPTPAEIAIIFTLVVSSGFAWMVVEPISYYGVLGAAGSYMAFLSGNISNMRLPCAMVAQEVTGVKPGTKEGELMATIGIAGSIVTNLIFVTLGAIGGTLLLGALPASVKDAFKYVPASIFAIMFTNFMLKRPDLGAFGVISALLILTVGSMFIPLPLQMLLNVVLVVAVDILIYRKKKKI